MDKTKEKFFVVKKFISITKENIKLYDEYIKLQRQYICLQKENNKLHDMLKKNVEEQTKSLMEYNCLLEELIKNYPGLAVTIYDGAKKRIL